MSCEGYYGLKHIIVLNYDFHVTLAIIYVRPMLKRTIALEEKKSKAFLGNRANF